MNITQEQLHKINGETVMIVTLYGRNRDMEITEYHKKVMVDKFGLNINYFECPFPAVSHGFCMNHIIKDTIDTVKPTYYAFIDHDCIMLKKECLNLMYLLINNKLTVAGHVQQSNHKKNKQTESLIHPYASQAFLWFSSDLYNKLGRPCMDHWSEGSNEYGGDTAERLTYEAKRQGYIVSLLYPSSVVLPNSPVDSGMMFGMGNTFSNLVFHAMQQDNPRSKEVFIQKCQEILNK